MSRGETSRGETAPLRPVGLAGLGWGALLLARGPELFRLVQGRDASRGERDAVLVLGVRHAGQGLLQVLLPHHLATLYVVVDGLHAASMAALAATSPPTRRRAVVLSGAIAVLGGAAALRARAA